MLFWGFCTFLSKTVHRIYCLTQYEIRYAMVSNNKFPNWSVKLLGVYAVIVALLEQ